MSHDASNAAMANGRMPSRRRKLSARGAAPPTSPSHRSTQPRNLDSLRSVFLDQQLAQEAMMGQPWAALDSAGVPFPDPLNVTRYNSKCAPDTLTAVCVLCEAALQLPSWCLPWLRTRLYRLGHRTDLGGIHFLIMCRCYN